MRKIIIAGGAGFLGQVLTDHFSALGDIVTVLTRGLSREEQNVKYINWDGESLSSWEECLEGADVLINLSGRSVNCRYNTKNKYEIYESRLRSTRVLAEALRTCEKIPKLFIRI